MKNKPPCPKCCGTNVKTLGGRTHGKYGYICEEVGCDTQWQQIPPHRIDIDEKDVDYDVVISDSKTKRGESYRCGRCGQPKKGHTCTAITDNSSELTGIGNNILPLLSLPPISTNTFIPPTPALFETSATSLLPFNGFTDVPPPPSSVLSLGVSNN